ncbi:type II toxin-antitoxin system RnlB family antitoxin [Pseudodesulfovibrio sp.]|uniref:type II toxin-antitoxin system RnlB family antitoxin n=1 Tax=unclassified Pseudodesulfovibrio TaxID=2661612 RepID=UPI003B00D855
MMKLYRMRKTDQPEYGYVIFSASHLSPFEQLGQLETELAQKGYEGPVLIDLLLTTGNRTSRFHETSFNGKSLALNSLQPARHIREELSKFIKGFYLKHISKLDTSILTKPTCYKLRKGLEV